MTRSSPGRRLHARPAARGVKRGKAAGGASGRAGKPPKRVKVVRDSFTMPASDYERIDALKRRALVLGQEKKKSEVLRAGLHALEQLADADLVRLLASIEPVKTGRPPGGKKKRHPRAGK